jgi:chemotaxis protein MotC
MKFGTASLFLLILAVTTCEPSVAGGGSKQFDASNFVHWVRSVLIAQVDLASGRRTVEEYLSSSAIMAVRSTAIDASLWKDVRQQNAAIALYIIDGGLDPTNQLQQVMHAGVRLTEPARTIASGGGDFANSLKTITGMKSGQTVLALSALGSGMRTQDKNALAQRLLSFARLNAPGTLIEEAALRKQSTLEALDGNFSRAIKIAAKYHRRFPNSIFLSDHLKKICREIANRATSAPSVQDDLIATSLNEASSLRDQGFVSALLRQMLLFGKLKQASNVATLTIQNSPNGNPARAGNIEVYDAAAKLATLKARSHLYEFLKTSHISFNSKDRQFLYFLMLLLSKTQASELNQKLTAIEHSIARHETPSPAIAAAKILAEQTATKSRLSLRASYSVTK